MADGADRNAGIGSAFLAAAARHSERTAILTPAGGCSYAALAELALGRAAEFGDGAPARPLALAMPRGVPLVAAILGAAIARRPWTVLTQPLAEAGFYQQLRAVGACDVFGIENATPDIALPPRGGPGHSLSGDDPQALAAICFTSGSTGEPRGVALRHDATVHNAAQARTSLQIEPDDRYLWLASPSSAATCTALFTTLLHGACLVPADFATLGFPRLAAWILEARATVFHAIPAVFRRFVRSVSDPEPLASLRLVKLGGEPVFPADVSLFDQCFPSASRLVNGLGMSEANGNVCHELLKRAAAFGEQVPIGRALPGFRLSLHDDDGRIVAPGEIGRLWIESANLAAGYWDNRSGSVAAFPAAAQGSARRLFKSQDRCIALDDGRLVHCGRADGVAKVRGLRVSMSAVEARLRGLPGVAEAVTAAPAMAASLSAWVEPVPGATLSASEIRACLALTLPPEAVPGSIAIVKAMPLLPGGKIDRRALVDTAAPPAPAPPRTGVARTAQLFGEALGRRSFGRQEDFFEAGGDSLAAVTLAAALQAEWGEVLEPADLSAHPTAAGLHDALLSRSNLRPAVRLSTGEGSRPLWLIAAAGVSSFHLLPLARALGRTSYGFVAGVGERGHVATRVEDMTEPMLEAVRRIQPQGPYLLAGASFGGWLALDLAHRLNRAGEEVAFVGMLDAAGPGYPRLAPGAPFNARRVIYEKAVFRNYQAGLSGGPLRRRMLAFVRRMRTVARVVTGANPETLDIVQRYNCLNEACLLAKRRYTPVRFPGQITTFHARPYGPGPFQVDPALGWSPYSAQPIEAIAIAGDHSDYIRAPHATGLAVQIAAALQRRGL